MTTTLETIDLSDHDAFVDAVPYEWFRTLRHEAPVYFNPERDGPGFYAVTRYADLFPQDNQRDVRSQLALSLRAVLAQRLLPDPERGAKRLAGDAEHSPEDEQNEQRGNHAWRGEQDRRAQLLGIE